MNLQEQISRIHEVMGVINESKFFHRRVNLDKVEEMLKLPLLIVPDQTLVAPILLFY